MDHTFQILKAFIFTIRLLNFLQTTSMSNKFAITLQDHFCSFSTFLILAPTMPTELQGIAQRLMIHFHTETYVLQLPGQTST